jgi:glucose-6-phosphate 1-dehydrogenase
VLGKRIGDHAMARLEAYERLIHDALLGDRTLFTRADGIERLWEVATPLLERPPAVERYAPGSWGPDSVEHLIAPRRWHLPEDAPMTRSKPSIGVFVCVRCW